MTASKSVHKPPDDPVQAHFDPDHAVQPDDPVQPNDPVQANFDPDDPVQGVALIIHGHFYQPPREDPWTEEIEGEPSAAPFANWNERIHSECYRPNAHSRLLGEYGKISSIVNNYSLLSFNFGPTLLSWMERFDPQTLAALVTADGESARLNNGHGNAIAQAYNHMIMPLADDHDKETQILWGLADFRHRFGRNPEAMWMPETAVDIDTLEMLVKFGMKYVILSPHQASEIEGPDGKAKKIADGKFDTSQAYWIKTHTSRIPAFFYHGSLAADVSFNHILRSADTFADRVTAAFGNYRMVNIATDGEIYGHHEPFGDMGLAYAMTEHFSGKSERLTKSVRITNYAAFLERHPPHREAWLKPGGSSWSCAHGVERWRADCGCRSNITNGWNQAWRAPLREGLDTLRDALRKVFEAEGARVFKDPWGARNAYINIVLNDYDAADKVEFAEQWFRGFRGFKKSRATDAANVAHDSERAGEKHSVPWRLLESQRNAMLMFTSCGWFFDDISGIEPKQLMLYASRAVDALGDLAPSGIEEKFVRRLRDAKSNDPACGDGEKIYKAITHPRTTAKMRVLNQAILSNYAGIKSHGRGRYSLEFSGEAFWDIEAPPPTAIGAGGSRDEEIKLGRGTTRVKDVRTELERAYAWVGRFNPPPETLIFDVGESFRWPGGDPRGKPWEKIRPVVAGRKGTIAMDVRDLFKTEARVIIAEELRMVDGNLDVLLRGAMAALEPVLDLAGALAIPPDPLYADLLLVNAEFVWSCHIRNGRFEDARRLEHRLARLGVTLSKKSISAFFSDEIDKLARPLASERRLSAEFDQGAEPFRKLLSTLRIVQEHGAVIEARMAQEAIFNLLKGQGAAMIGAILSKGNRKTYEELLGLLDAAERLYIDISAERKLLAPFEKTFADDPKYWP